MPEPECIKHIVAGNEIKIYPVLFQTLQYLSKNRRGIRYEKRLTARDARRLISGEVSLDDFKKNKEENDKKKLEMQNEEWTMEDDEPSYEKAVKRKPRKKRKANEICRCRICDSYRLRVVNYNRLDEMNILECANRKCLATVQLTNMPTGTTVEAPTGTAANYGWMMDSIWNFRYPKLSRIESGQLTTRPVIPDVEIEDDDEMAQWMHCPGQAELVKIM